MIEVHFALKTLSLLSSLSRYYHHHDHYNFIDRITLDLCNHDDYGDGLVHHHLIVYHHHHMYRVISHNLSLIYTLQRQHHNVIW